MDRDKVVETVNEAAGRGLEAQYGAIDTIGVDFGASGLMRNLISGNNEASATGAIFFAANVLTAGGESKAVVVGERMATRVIPVAEELGASVYKPTSKVAENCLANNTRWIQRQIASGKRIFDIGPGGGG